MNARDIPRHKFWTSDQPSSVPLHPWTASEPYKDFFGYDNYNYNDDDDNEIEGEDE